ncbi:MAG: response regulator [Spirochaetaceae bacterium]|jgi:DNA-binding response OmpR family regulator|nr:response regulator [Spirochaetaceae bacterium]
MNKILVVDESVLFRKFAISQLEYYGFKVETGRSAFDGLNKLRSIHADLVIINDGLNRQSVANFLKKKSEDINLKDIPVIFIAKEFSQERIVELCRIKVRRFLVKPLKMDLFLSTISSIFGNEIFVDSTECQVNLHVNENLILVEVARGFNRTKLDLIQWKLKEIILANKIESPKIMLLITDVTIDDEAESILSNLLNSIIIIPDSHDDVKILTNDKHIRNAIKLIPKYENIDIFNSLIEAIDSFFGKKGLEKLTSNQDMVHQIYLSTSDNFDTSGIIDLNFKEEQKQH